jgi:hypothetical protein
MALTRDAISVSIGSQGPIMVIQEPKSSRTRSAPVLALTHGPQRPAEYLAAECVQDDSEVAELLRQMHADGVSHPELIEVGEHYTTGKTGNDAPVVDTSSSLSAQTGPAQAQKLVLAHQVPHPPDATGLPRRARHRGQTDE